MGAKKDVDERTAEMAKREAGEKVAEELRAYLTALPPDQLLDLIAGFYHLVRPWILEMVKNSPSKIDDWVISFLDRVLGPG